MKIQGVLPVLQLPYHEDFSIDFESFEREIDWLFECGVNGVTLAMVSEILRLSDNERDEVVAKSVKFTKGRGPVIASVGAESAHQAIRHAKAAEAAGATSFMAIPPSLTRCQTSEIIEYYQAILNATSLPLIIQDASGYVGNSIPIETQADLYLQNPERILFKPESLPFGPNLSRLLEATGGKAPIFDGTGGIALVECFQRGIIGTMPGSDMPWALVALWKALASGDMELARRIHMPIATLVSMYHNLDAFLVVEKNLLVKQGIFKNTLVRRPVGYHLDEKTKEEVLTLFALIEEACK